MGSQRVGVAETLHRCLARSCARILDNEAGVIEGADPEATHQARVGARRLRSDLKTFGRFVNPEFASHLRDEVRWLGADLGAVRDLEVLRDRLYDHAGGLARGEHLVVERVLHRIDADRYAARQHLLATLRSGRYMKLRDTLTAAAGAPALRARAERATRRDVRKVVKKRWRKVRDAVDALDRDPTDAQLHNVRIRAKQCRYACEAVVPLFGSDARRLARAMAGVQDVLGEQHDAVVASTWIAKTVVDDDVSAELAFALGQLAHVEHLADADARDTFTATWQRASRPKLRRWLS